MRSLLRAVLLPLALVAVVPAVSAAQAKIPAGTYEMVPDANYSAGFDVTGLMVEFTENSMTALQAGTILVKSTFTYQGDIITLTDVEGQVACPSQAKYRVSITDKGVRLTPVEDPCEGRPAVLAQVTMVKKG
jgi:hypothetical protein